MRRKKLLEKIWQFLKLFDCFGRNLVFLSFFAIFSNFWLFTFRHICCVWGGKNCQRRFGKTLPQSRKWCQFLAIKIRTRWCSQNWRTGVYQTETASQVCKKNIWSLIDFPAKNNLVEIIFRLAECESTVGNLSNKLDSLEKSKVKLQTEIESKN